MVRSILRISFITVLLLVTVHVSKGQSAVQDNERFIDVNGTRLFLRIAGNGEPIIVIHGGPGMSHDYLAPQLIELLAKDYQLVFYDQRASGRSSGVGDTASLNISQFVSDLDMLRQRLKIDRLNLLGHSFGGLLAMYYAISHPDHVNKLLLIDTSPASWELNFPYFRKTIAERQTEQDRQELNTLKLKNDFSTNPAVMDRYLKIYFKPFFKEPALSQQLSLGIDKNWISHFNVTNDAVWNNLGHYDIHDKLKDIKASTLVMHGDYSVISIDGAKAIASHIPNSKLVILKDVGHFPYIEAPKEFSSAIKAFWAK